MHPAKSVILFTISSGAGYGLLSVLFVYSFFAGVEPGSAFVITAFAVALSLIVIGLLSSTLHLGHPERAWRALSQWRTSWLSREGVLALLTFIPALLFVYFWLTHGMTSIDTLASGGVAAALALATVLCTAMIYASLRAIPAWRNLWTLPVYISFSVMTGTVLFNFLIVLFAVPSSDLPVFSSLGFLIAGWLVKSLYWAHIKGAAPAATIQQATGLSAASVRQLDPPHDGANYLLDEMGFRIARKHASILRRIAIILGFLLPTSLLGAGQVFNFDQQLVPAAIALLSISIGVITERWLFFAEAKHVMTLYYGEQGV